MADHKREIDFDSSPEDRIEAVKAVGKDFGSDLTQCCERDGDGKVVSIAVYASGETAVKLERWLSLGNV